MSYTHYERLSALDSSFLFVEDENCHMHIGGVSLYDATPLATPDGGVDIGRIQTAVAAGIHRIPRYRQRLMWIPGVGNPVWVDDTRFNVAYHVRHTHLPRPGDERQLKRLTGRIMSQQLDRGKPLWEMWVVEGLQGNRFAVITKIHHCMIDGVGSVDLMNIVMRTTPDRDPRLEGPPPAWIPRPAPSGTRLVVDDLLHRAAMPCAVASGIGRAVTRPRETASALWDRVASIGEALGAGLFPAPPTPLNSTIGPHRRFDWAEMDLDAMKTIRKRLGGTINDIVLAVFSGGMRRFLKGRGVDVNHLDYRAMMPVNVRTAETRSTLGNKVAMMVGHLPLDERDPRERLQRVILATTELKRSRQAAGVRTIEEVSDASFSTIFVEFSKLASLVQPFNVVVTNVPGPSFSAYVLGARLLACYPLVPLFRNQGLGVALFSYAGKLYWGFNADWDLIPDLHDLVEAVGIEFETLCSAAGAVAAAEAPAVQTAPAADETPTEGGAAGANGGNPARP